MNNDEDRAKAQAEKDARLAEGFGAGRIILDRLPSRRKNAVNAEAAKAAAAKLKERAVKRLNRWLRANPGRDPVTEAPRAIREAVGFKDQHRREVRQGGGLRPNVKRSGKRQKDRVLWVKHLFRGGKLREVTMHATKGERVRRV